MSRPGTLSHVTSRSFAPLTIRGLRQASNIAAMIPGSCRTVVPAFERDESRRRMNRICSEWRCAVLAGMFMLASAAGAAEPPVRQVLLLQSFNRGILVVDHFTGDLRVELDQRARQAGERGSGRRGSDGVCRRVRASSRRLHTFHVCRSTAAGSHDHHRRPCSGIRAQVSCAALSRHAAPVRVGG